MFVIILKVGRSEWCDTFVQEDKKTAVERLNKIADQQAHNGYIVAKTRGRGFIEGRTIKPDPNDIFGRAKGQKTAYWRIVER